MVSRNIPIVQSTTFRYATGGRWEPSSTWRRAATSTPASRTPRMTTWRPRSAPWRGTAAMLTSSGQAASFYAIFNIVSCGEHGVLLLHLRRYL
ncbi:MAG: hypothetical protein ACLRIS_08950 [Flavonifractor plautii]